MTISLPQTPDGEQYEDLVAAGLRALGYFIETQLILREGTKEVLELDVVATPTGGTVQDRILFEAKKERFRFPNVFKLFGQRTYLEIPTATLVSMEGTDPALLQVYEAKGKEMGVRACHFAPDPDSIRVLAEQRNGLADAELSVVAGTAWYQQIARRIALSSLIQECNARKGTPPCDAIRTYLFNVRASFFLPTPLARAEALYSAYLASPRMSGDALELIRAGTTLSPQETWNLVNDTHQHPWIQGIMASEGAARIAIIKNALDDFLDRGALPPPASTLTIGTLSYNVPAYALPVSFHAGLEALRAHPNAARLPYLFQCFAELLGGFLNYRDSAELEFVERLTGVPAGEIVGALGLLDHFFAAAGKSVLYRTRDQLLCLKMTPGFVRGGGSFLRQSLFDLKDYPVKYPDVGWLLGKWHNAAYSHLEPTLKKS
jgi:hypothetical protein